VPYSREKKCENFFLSKLKIFVPKKLAKVLSYLSQNTAITAEKVIIKQEKCLMCLPKLVKIVIIIFPPAVFFNNVAANSALGVHRADGAGGGGLLHDDDHFSRPKMSLNQAIMQSCTKFRSLCFDRCYVF
jgi:hypothetical protein